MTYRICRALGPAAGARCALASGLADEPEDEPACHDQDLWPTQLGLNSLERRRSGSQARSGERTLGQASESPLGSSASVGSRASASTPT